MHDVDNSKEELVTEVARLRQRVAELEKSEVVLKKEAIINTLAEHVIHEDREMKVLWANEAACNSAGLSREELIGRHCYEIWPKRNDPCPDCPVVKAMETGQLQEVEKMTLDGRSWFIRGYPLRDEKDNIIGGIEFTLEITARKQAEDALRESEERYRSLFENSQDAILLTAPDGSILDSNPAACQMFGRTAEEIKQIGRDGLVDATDPRLDAALKERARRGKVRAEITMIRADGSKFPVEITSTIFIDEQGQQRTSMIIHDISGRKRAEETLQESEKRYRFLFENSQTINILIGIDGKILDINESAALSLGYKKKSIIGKEVVDFVIPEQREKVAEQLAQELCGDYTPSLEIDIITTKGTRTLFFTVGHATLFEKGELTGILLSAVDITERKQAEDALREGEERFRTIFETARDFIFLKDSESKFTAVNPAMERLYGVPASKLIGKTGAAVFGEEMAAHLREKDLRVLKGEIILEEHSSPAKGSTDIHHIIKVPIRNNAGEIIGLCGIGRDVTERKHMEEALRKSEERFRKVVETMKVGLASTDENGILTYVNEYYSSMIGHPVDEMVGHDPTDFYYDEGGRKAQKEIFEKRKKGMRDAPTHEVAWRTNDGRKVYSILSPTPMFDAEGRYTGSFAIHTDITDSKRIEEELRESEEKYRSLVESSEDSIYLVDRNCNYIFLNNRHLSKLSVGSRQAIGRAYGEFHPPEETKNFAQKVKEVLKTGMSQSYEYRSQRDNRYFIQTLSPVTSSDCGVINAITVISKDITERKLAEEALCEREAFNYALFHYNPAETIVVDLEGRVLAFNLAKEKSGGRLPHIGDRMYKDYAGKHEIDMRAELMKCIRSGNIKKFSERKYEDNCLNITISPFSGGAIIISEDVTEHKRAEEALRESDKFNASLLNDSPHPIIVINPDTSIRYVNPALVKLIGFSAVELIGRKAPYPWWTEKTMCKTKNDFAMGMRNGIQGMEEHFQTKTGERFWVEITSRSIMQEGEPQYFLANWIDITERKQAEEAFRESERFSSSLRNESPHPIIVINPDTSIRYVNPAMVNLTGFSAEELIGRKVPYPWWPKGTVRRTTRSLKEALCKELHSLEKNFQKKSGEQFWVEITAISAMRDGEVQYMLANWIDITERKQAEELLQRERDTFYSILDRAPYGVMVQDTAGNHSFINTELTNITGYTREDIPTVQEWLHLAYPNEPYRHMVLDTWKDDYTQRKADETFRERFGRVFSRVFNVVCKDGVAKEIEFRTSFRGDEGTVFMLSDTTDRKRMHALLETAAAEWRTTFDAISDAVCLLDPHGRIIRCNDAMLRLIGKPFSHITGHHCWEVMHGVSEAPQRCPILRAGQSHHRETEAIPKDSRWFNVSVDPLLDGDGNFVGGVHIMSDITERKRIDDELNNSREQLRNLALYLETVREQERTNIAREIHDELAQTLTALKMDVSWLDRRLPNDADSLSAKTKAMNTLIDSTIRTMKRISAELRPGILDDLGLVAAIEWQAEEFQNRTNVKCNITVDPEDIAVNQDRATAIFRIFQETLTNVTRHARATRVAVSLKEKSGKLTLRVKDNGVGISDEQISDPQSFGLIGMRERIIPWSGTISFKGIPDKGTTVTVSVELSRSKKNIEKIE